MFFYFIIISPDFYSCVHLTTWIPSHQLAWRRYAPLRRNRVLFKSNCPLALVSCHSSFLLLASSGIWHPHSPSLMSSQLPFQTRAFNKYLSRVYRVCLTKPPTFLFVSFNQKAISGFPGGSVVMNPPATARDIALDPQSGGIPRATEQLACVTAT